MCNLEEVAIVIKKNKLEFKYALLLDLMNKADNDELKYLIRFLEKNLKLGISEKILLLSLSRAVSNIMKDTYERDAYKKLTKSLNQTKNEEIVFGHMMELIAKNENIYKLIELCYIRCNILLAFKISDSTNGV